MYFSEMVMIVKILDQKTSSYERKLGNHRAFHYAPLLLDKERFE
jgi:hypothetical protein